MSVLNLDVTSRIELSFLDCAIHALHGKEAELLKKLI